ncbi:hypothetical protein M2150_001891 [Lachnospiraceae bacterium PM6-15]|uniref:DUF3021 domain-containing protein n=1 Tax=Ohessyouella blattaphilus TaxID=2949333 RepID=A0ABT1EIC0_9FIRM|nr:hypothetical protein [Ohessyouella blattaphilus]MCP1110428.1 hypothetical protein [Ohessyouella blattaphilus]MCR8563822.1 hypothetical protein [Ohessyouella blattaphilus]MDL2250001.1 hypothetical protein [Lachnospiraceae bacterium OttesenSCG-928-J05]
MKKLRILRDLFLIFAIAFIAIIVLTMFAGVAHTNQTIKQALLVAGCYAAMSLLFFWDSLIERIGYLPIEIFYVVMLNITYVLLSRVFSWNFSPRGYFINISATIVGYVFIKLIIFSIDTHQADEINDIIKKRHEEGDQE